MNCSEFESRVHLWIASDGSPAPDTAAAEHLATCPRCARLFALATGGAEIDLTRSILEKTSGNACGSVLDRVCAQLDGDSDESQKTLVDGHLAHCPDCSELARTLSWMKQALPALAEVEPDVAFVSDVLEETTRADRRARRAVAQETPLASALRRLIHRPRIALELAYVGAAVFYLVAGPQAVSILRESSGPRSALSNPAEAVTEIMSRGPALPDPIRDASAEIWNATGGLALAAGRDLVAGAARGGSRVHATLQIAGQFLEAAGRGLLRADTVSIWRAAEAARERLRDCWEARPAQTKGEPSGAAARTPEQSERSTNPETRGTESQEPEWRSR